MGYKANTEPVDIENFDKEPLTLEKVRKNADIDIMLPLPAEASTEYDKYEYVIVNGKTTQIRCGEPIGVSWEIYEALKHGRYANTNILV